MKEKPDPQRAGEQRFWEVDAARGVAILMMVLYHLMYDLDVFGGYAIDSTSGFWAYFADATAFAFVFLVGVSLSLSYARTLSGRGSGRTLFGKYLLRGLKIIGYGMVITLAFWLLGAGTVIFGILHLIGVSIILAYLFLRFRLLNLFAGLAVIAAGAYINAQNFSSESPWLLPLGVVPENLFMPDYRPLLPWFGVVLAGLFFGKLLYADGKRTFDLPGGRPAVARPLVPLGRNSLFIYMVHQPALIGLLALLGVIQFGAP